MERNVTTASIFNLLNPWVQHYVFLSTFTTRRNISHARDWSAQVPPLFGRVRVLCQFEEYSHIVQSYKLIAQIYEQFIPIL
jgi:hypothetical protein